MLEPRPRAKLGERGYAIKTREGRIKKTSGSLRILGEDPARARNQVVIGPGRGAIAAHASPNACS